MRTGPRSWAAAAPWSRPHYIVSPLDGIRQRAGATATVGYAIGCPMHKIPPLFDADWLAAGRRCGSAASPAHYFDNRELSGEPVHTAVTDRTDLVWFGTKLPHIDDTADFSLRLSGTFIAPATGVYTLSLASAGKSRLFLDGEQIIDLWDSCDRTSAIREHRERTGQIELRVGPILPAGRRVRRAAGADLAEPAVWAACRRCPPTRWRSRGALAADSDVAIVFAGLTDEWESEGFDRPDMELPGDQAQLIEAVAAANPHTIVVLNSGAPVSMTGSTRWPRCSRPGIPARRPATRSPMCYLAT